MDASATLRLLLAACVRACVWVCTTLFALASLEPEMRLLAPACVFSCWNAYFFGCLQDELAIIWADLVAKITAANATAIPCCGTLIGRSLRGLTE
jgi:hypothetical protein